MLTRILTIIIFLSCSIPAVYGQILKKKKKNKEQEQQELSQPSSLNPGASSHTYEPKRQRVKSGLDITYDSERKYYERREMAAKARRKGEKEMMKPQYSDPMYFGHKKPPKKRKPGKMKYCKECGMRH